MRVLVLALAILLLPLLGGFGDAMALQMAQQQTPQPAGMAHAGHGEGAHAAHAAQAGHEEAASATSSDCQTTCTNCQLCHSVAMTVWPEVPMLAEAPRPAPAFEPASFASAEPGQGFKPPISRSPCP